MEKADIQAGLRSLRQSLERIKTLSAWAQLEQAQASPEQPLAFALGDSTEADLRNEYSFFVATSMRIRRLLSDGSSAIPAQDCDRIKHQLARIEQQLCRLDLNRRRCLW